MESKSNYIVINESTCDWVKLSNKIFHYLIDYDYSNDNNFTIDFSNSFAIDIETATEFLQFLINKKIISVVPEEEIIEECKNNISITYFVTNRCNSKCITCFKDANNEIRSEIESREIADIFTNISENYMCIKGSMSIVGVKKS
ncbi:MAG: hypothetical protein PHD66_02895 [Eubacteriales bacterium]|nr:hypothetical protein [Eubacteriales bacterium]